MGELPHHHEDQKRLERLRSFIQEPESFQEVANLCRLLSDNSRAADTEVAQLLHQIIERTVEVTCPQSDSQLVSGAPHLPPLDQHDYCGSCPAEQLEVIRQVHRFLTEHLDSRITIEQLSRQFLMNPSTMKELFKEVYGNSIAAHIRQHRMERASALLLESDDSVAQIARTVGYESQSKFTSEFKKAFSMLPTEYRRLHKRA